MGRSIRSAVWMILFAAGAAACGDGSGAEDAGELGPDASGRDGGVGRGGGQGRDAGEAATDGGSTERDAAVTGRCTSPWFSDDLEWENVQQAVAEGPWVERVGDVSISTRYAHSGTRSLRVAYGSNEAASHLALVIPGGTDHFFCRWWELRERAGDFPGANDFDWGGEKFNRFRSEIIGTSPTGGLDYPLGWVAEGGYGLPGTQGPGEIQLFGNSVASNDSIHFSHVYRMPRGEWHSFELELALGTRGENDGESRLFIDGEEVVEVTNVVFRPNTDATIDIIWIGGWYSNTGVDPDPSPAVRYVDDVVVCPERIGE